MNKVVWGFVGNRGIEFNRGFYSEDRFKEAFAELVRINAPAIEANIAEWGEEYYFGKTYIEICRNQYLIDEIDDYWIPDEDNEFFMVKLILTVHD